MNGLSYKYIYLMVLCIVLCGGSAYDFVCPHASHRTLRSTYVCQGKPLNQYSCLYDMERSVYTESCSARLNFVRPGQRYIIARKRNNVDCMSTRYQPFKFWSNIQSDCIYEKSQCQELGNNVVEKTSSIKDNECTCDYVQGFNFIVTPRNGVSCKIAEEDCSCYQTPLRQLSAIKVHNSDMKQNIPATESNETIPVSEDVSFSWLLNADSVLDERNELTYIIIGILFLIFVCFLVFIRIKVITGKSDFRSTMRSTCNNKFRCIQCRHTIATSAKMISKTSNSAKHSRQENDILIQEFQDNYGIKERYQVITSTKANVILADNNTKKENSWFDDYKWQRVICMFCRDKEMLIGWKYTSLKNKKEHFYGLPLNFLLEPNYHHIQCSVPSCRFKVAFGDNIISRTDVTSDGKGKTTVFSGRKDAKSHEITINGSQKRIVFVCTATVNENENEAETETTCPVPEHEWFRIYCRNTKDSNQHLGWKFVYHGHAVTKTFYGLLTDKVEDDDSRQIL